MWEILIWVLAAIFIIGGIWMMIYLERKRWRSNLFFQKDNTDLMVEFRHFVTGVDEDFNTEVYVEFYRLDNHTTYVMSHKKFLEKFQKL